MFQTVVVLILLAADALVLGTNGTMSSTLFTLFVPGSPGQTLAVTWADVFVGAGAALILTWAAGRIDRAGCDAAIRSMSDEMLRLKASTYDEQRQPLADIRVRLDRLDRDLGGLRARLDREPLRRDETARTATAAAVPEERRAS